MLTIMSFSNKVTPRRRFEIPDIPSEIVNISFSLCFAAWTIINKMLVLTVLMLQVLAVIDGHRILGIFTHIGGSHFHTFYPIMNGLASKGHDVTVLSYFKSKNASIHYKELIFEGLPIINSSISLDVVRIYRYS